MYYKDENNNPYFEPSKEVVEKYSLVEIDKELFDSLVYEINNPRITEEERILSIKLKCGQIIKSKYSIEWQLNHPRMDATYSNDYTWIDNIRKISNEAEVNGTALEDIDWNIYG